MNTSKTDPIISLLGKGHSHNDNINGKSTSVIDHTE